MEDCIAENRILR
jgi:3-methyladenine DNA glycosylase Tag